METQNTNRDLDQEIEQLKNLKENKRIIQEAKGRLEKATDPTAFGLYANGSEIALNKKLFGNFEVLASTFKTLALDDLNKQLAKIDQEIKTRLKQ